MKLKSATKPAAAKSSIRDLGGAYVSGTGTRGLEAARDFWQVHRVKQQPNPAENSSQFAVWWFKVVMDTELQPLP
jgi:hypothetical protein